MTIWKTAGEQQRKTISTRRCATGCEQYVFLWFTGRRRFFFVSVPEHRLYTEKDSRNS